MASAKPTVSVVIPAYNEATYIDRLLEALSKQSYKNFEVIVSDADSGDGTDKVVASFKDPLAAKLVSSPPKGPGAGRNAGARAARGDWLLFLDADVDIDDPNFIQELVEQTSLCGWDTSSARLAARGKAAKAYSNLYRYQRWLSHTRRPVASGYCIFTSTAVFKKAGGFNEKIQFGEDYEYVSRTGRGGKFGFVDTTYYYVDPRRNENEGWKLTYKGTLNEIYRLLLGYKKLEKKPIKYEFGQHKKRAK